MKLSLKKKSEIADRVYVTLDRLYPDATCSLDMDDPYFFLIRAILSAQCTDVRVNRTVNELKQLVKSPEDVLAMGEERLAEVIKPCGLYKAKAANIIRSTSIYTNDWGHDIPKDIDMLLSAPGIGKKIGNLLLGELYDIPALVVDTHFKRVAHRLGLTDSKEPLKVEEDVCKVLDKSRWNRCGHLFVEFGRNICDARKPKCDSCPFKDICREGKP